LFLIDYFKGPAAALQHSMIGQRGIRGGCQDCFKTTAFFLPYLRLAAARRCLSLPNIHP
jgi:hypothetical protein